MTPDLRVADRSPEARESAAEATTERREAADASPDAPPSDEGGRRPSETSPRASPEPLPLDVVFQLLSAGRRRHVLRYLRDDDRTTTVGALAEHVAAIENGKTERALTSAERKRVYVGLYQCHLPKMDDADVIDFAKARGTVERGVNADRLDRYLDVGEDAAVPVDRLTYAAGLAGLGVGSLLALTALWSGMGTPAVVLGSLLVLVAARAVRAAG